jgi:hypothetical protein
MLGTWFLYSEVLYHTLHAFGSLLHPWKIEDATHGDWEVTAPQIGSDRAAIWK